MMEAIASRGKGVCYFIGSIENVSGTGYSFSVYYLIHDYITAV